MFQRAEVHPVSHHRDVEKGSWEQFARQNARLVQMQSAGPRENNGSAGINAHRLVALAVKISEPARERFENVLDAARIVLPGIGGGVFPVAHHLPEAGI